MGSILYLKFLLSQLLGKQCGRSHQWLIQEKPSVIRCQQCVKRGHEKGDCVAVLGETTRNTWAKKGLKCFLLLSGLTLTARLLQYLKNIFRDSREDSVFLWQRDRKSQRRLVTDLREVLSEACCYYRDQAVLQKKLYLTQSVMWWINPMMEQRINVLPVQQLWRVESLWQKER